MAAHRNYRLRTVDRLSFTFLQSAEANSRKFTVSAFSNIADDDYVTVMSAAVTQRRGQDGLNIFGGPASEVEAATEELAEQ